MKKVHEKKGWEKKNEIEDREKEEILKKVDVESTKRLEKKTIEDDKSKKIRSSLRSKDKDRMKMKKEKNVQQQKDRGFHGISIVVIIIIVCSFQLWLNYGNVVYEVTSRIELANVTNEGQSQVDLDERQLIKDVRTKSFGKFYDVIPIVKNDIVLRIDPDVKRGQWKMGKIIKTYTGTDGRVRSVKVITASTILNRPITKLCLLIAANEYDHCK